MRDGVLCVCGNQAISPMMAALLMQQKIRAASARINKEAPSSPFARTALVKQEIKPLAQNTEWIGDTVLTRYAHIVCADAQTADWVRAFLGGTGGVQIIVVNERRGGILDPQGQGLPAYEKCLTTLRKLMPSIAAKILE